MVKIHPTAEVSKNAIIGKGTNIWNQAQIREKAKIGENCTIGKNVYIDFGVVIGKNVKIQNNVSVYHGVTIKDGVFVGPHVCFTNDKIPRAINREGTIKKSSDWEINKTLVKRGASIGANSTILPGIEIGKFSMIGAGSTVTRDIPNFGLVFGSPARMKGYVCYCGAKIPKNYKKEMCQNCKRKLPKVFK